MRAVLRRANGDVQQASREFTLGVLRLDFETLEASADGRPIHLTNAEFRVLELLMRAPGRAQSREFLTESALGRRLSAYDRSIDTHISNLRRKLAVQKRSAGVKIRSIRGAGYVLTSSDTRTREDAVLPDFRFILARHGADPWRRGRRYGDGRVVSHHDAQQHRSWGCASGREYGLARQRHAGSAHLAGKRRRRASGPRHLCSRCVGRRHLAADIARARRAVACPRRQAAGG